MYLQPENLSISTADWLNMSAPLKSDRTFDRCNIFDVDYDVVKERPEETTPLRSCQSWEFAKEPFQVNKFVKTDYILSLDYVVWSCF